MIYILHPESCSAFTVATRAEADQVLESDPLALEASREEFVKACKEWGITCADE